ncbi:MAG: serine/threonine-protein kinase [Acidobacteria bacterium]|nr:serine/threonine-protein kinase [Acidobacteriota bacterium]
MSLATGMRLGPYEIVSPLGEGGMGEVYRAKDTRLGREVALKVLPAAVSRDADRLRRFGLEAQSTSELNHPNILTVFDVGAHDGTSYIVSELLEGETLREALDDAPLSVRKAVDYAQQIARGLAAAHERGVVHRDLKPENVFVTSDGRIKILDFGLAKVTERTGGDAAQTNVPTRKINTDPGTVMGTVGYMSPEQAAGRRVDHRSDIFSFGAVLYEMLTGKRAFRGDTAIETLNAILKEDPPEFSSVSNRALPPALESVVSHCLEKKPERRFQSASDVAFALEALSAHSGSNSTTIISHAPTARAMNRERLIWIGVSSLLFLAAAALAFIHFSRAQTATRTVRLSLATPERATSPARVTVSPDGARVVFVARSAEGKRVLWVRPLDALAAQPLAGTDDAVAPFWSPDSRSVGFFANGKLLKVDAAGGRPQALCDAGENRGGAWSRDGVILFGGVEGLYRVSAQGGTPQLATKIDPKEEAHRWPYFLPDGRHFVFLADAATTEDHHIRVGSLDSQESRILFGAVSTVAYAPPGYLLYVSQGALVAQGFDAVALKLTGDPATVAEHIAEVGQNHEFDFSVSEGGVLAYQTGNPNSQFVWLDREGKKLAAVGEPANYDTVSLSPDGRRAAVGMFDADGRASDVWLLDLARGSMSRLTFDPHGDGTPVWSPDGSRVAFGSNRLGGIGINLYEKAASGVGDEQILLRSDAAKYITSWSRDGQTLLFENWAAKSKGEVWLLPLSGDRQPKPLLQSAAFDQYQGQFSPDGRFVAYASQESGRAEVYVQPFPPSGDKWQISSGGGFAPLWSSDGRELFYATNDGKLMSAETKAAGAFENVVPRQLFQTGMKLAATYPYAVTADAQRFLVNVPVEATNPAPMTIVLNWTADLKR